MGLTVARVRGVTTLQALLVDARRDDRRIWEDRHAVDDEDGIDDNDDGGVSKAAATATEGGGSARRGSSSGRYT